MKKPPRITLKPLRDVYPELVVRTSVGTRCMHRDGETGATAWFWTDGKGKWLYLCEPCARRWNEGARRARR